MPATPLDLSAYAFTAEDLKALPAGPGVYRFIDRDGLVIYVGKAKNLRARGGSYFTPPAGGAAKGPALPGQTPRLPATPGAPGPEANPPEAAPVPGDPPPPN